MRFSPKKLGAQVGLGFVASAAFSFIFAGSASALSQGDIVYSENSSCTVGYVSGTTATAAGHCASDGANAYDAAGNHVGTWHTSAYQGNQYTDYGYVETFAPNGGNVYSGDAYAPDWALNPGFPVCKQGVSTGVSCGIITKRDGNTIHTIGAVPFPGDSGGAAWIPGLGYAGNATLYYNYPTIPGVYTGVYTR